MSSAHRLIAQRPGLALMAALAFPLGLHAQNEEDAVRLSGYQPMGTARSAGMGNAFGALGADGASAMINPGGMGLYRTSELSLSPLLEVNGTRSLFYGQNASDSQGRFAFGNLTLAIHNPGNSGSDWRSSTYGVVFERQATHHWRSNAAALGVPSSILQGFAMEAQGTPDTELLDRFPFTAGLAWETFGIDPAVVLGPGGDTLPNRYVSAVPTGALTDQRHAIESRGSTSNTAFFYAGNFKDLLYIGASVGIVGHRFRRTTTHEETTPDAALDLQDLRFSENLAVNGNGLDIKLGAVVRAHDRLRLGLAYHSPHWMQLNDSYATSMRTTFRTPDTQGRTAYSSSSPDGFFTYRLNTPSRWVASAAFIAGANGLVSIDYTYSDARNARFRPGDRFLNNYDFATENTTIRSALRAQHSLRAGTEWRYGPWYYRLGLGYVPDAFRTEELRHGRPTLLYSGGIGYRSEHVSVDLALQYQQGQRVFLPYAPEVVQPIAEDRRNYRAMVTVAFRP